MSTICSANCGAVGTLFWVKTLKICQPPSTTRNWNVNFLLEKVQDCWHFHELFRQLRFAKDSRRDVFHNDLGHVDSLLGRRHLRIEETEHVHQMFRHQRHRSVKRRQTRNGVDDLLHGVPLYLLRQKAARRAPAGEGGGGVSRIVAVWFCSLSPSPALAMFCPVGGGYSLPRPRRRSDVGAEATL